VKTVVAVDIWEWYPAYELFSKRMEPYPNVVPIRHPCQEVFKQFPDRTFDLVYIDAEHTYESVFRDIKQWLPKVKRGGWIAGHDYTHDVSYGGVVIAVDEVFGKPQKVYRDSSWIVQVK
jgi:predicted O-methyltransferase YrrM